MPSSGERFTGKDINSRKKLIEVLKNYENQIDPKDKKQKEIAFDRLVEEVAYTWFNRLVAIRFMEVNNYLPGRLRVLLVNRVFENLISLQISYLQIYIQKWMLLAKIE